MCNALKPLEDGHSHRIIAMSTYEPVVTQQILDLIASKSADQREARKMSKEVVDALKECGFFTMPYHLFQLSGVARIYQRGLNFSRPGGSVYNE